MKYLLILSCLLFTSVGWSNDDSNNSVDFSSKENLKLLSEYKSLLNEKLKIIALNNYPKSALRRKIEGDVHLIFTLKEDGKIKDIKIGPESTTDSTILINASKQALKRALSLNMNLPSYDTSHLFSITISYQINK